MTETVNRQNLHRSPDIPTREERSQRYGGTIRIKDFNTDYRGNDTKSSYVAENIAADMRFDERCRRNIEIRKGLLNNV